MKYARRLENGGCRWVDRECPDVTHFVGSLSACAWPCRGITFHQWLPIAEVWARIGAGTVGALILGLGFFSWTRRCSLPKSRNYRIEINYPTKNDEVDTFDVKGTIKKALPENYT